MCGLASTPGLFDLSGEWLSSCQTFEGGFGGEPGCEAHVRYDAQYLVLLSCLLFNNNLTRFHESLSCFHRGVIHTVRLLRYRY